MGMLNHLEKLRKNHPEKPSQRALGDVLGIAENNYRNLEKGKVKSITFIQLEKLCEFFKCNTNDIFEYIED